MNQGTKTTVTVHLAPVRRGHSRLVTHGSSLAVWQNQIIHSQHMDQLKFSVVLHAPTPTPTPFTNLKLEQSVMADPESIFHMKYLNNNCSFLSPYRVCVCVFIYIYINKEKS